MRIKQSPIKRGRVEIIPMIDVVFLLLVFFMLASQFGHDKALYDTIKEIHETIGTIGYYLIGLHAAAALAHHYLMHDNTLLRMLPRRR